MRKFRFLISCAAIAFMVACNPSHNNKKSIESSENHKPAMKEHPVLNSQKSYTTENASIDENEEQTILSEFIKDKVGDVAKAKALPLYAQDSLAAICAICNYKFEQNALRKSDKSSVQKSITIKKGNTSQNEVITLHYQNNQMIRVAKRLLDENNKVLKLDVFDLDANNNCFSRYQWTLETKYSFYDAIYNGSVIRYDMYNKYFTLSESQRQEIIFSAKSTLDSLMNSDSGHKIFVT